jgi:hypothetical protein
MPSDLDLLIDFYQWEKQRLLLSIEENKMDQDYLAVDYHYNELGHIQRELDCLLELKDSNYPKIKRLESEIAFFSKKEEPYVGFSEVYAPSLEKAKSELKKLKGEKTKTPSEETQIVDEALFSLLEGKIKGFTIYLGVEMDFLIDFIKKGSNQIMLSFKVPDENDASHLKQYGLLNNLGLIYDDTTRSLVHLFHVVPNKNILPIKETIARIVVVTKRFLRTKGTIYLKVTP